jgi:5-methylcytosine-specific restriction protein A
MQYGSIKPRVNKLAPSRLQTTAVYSSRTSRGDPSIRDRILNRDKGLCRCAACLQSGSLRPAQEVDHVVPLWAGGLETDGNRCAINVQCHKLKSGAEARMRAIGAFDAAPWATPCLLYVQGANGRFDTVGAGLISDQV